jgi:hypothetical protein
MSGRMTFNHTKLMYMVTRDALADEVEALYERGKRAVCITPVREWRYAESGISALCDYLIVYEDMPHPGAETGAG